MSGMAGTGPRWPVIRHLLERDPLGLGLTARSDTTRRLRRHIASADRVARSVCPYCAVGCGQLVYVGLDLSRGAGSGCG
jgi:formate dehydrogenase major subunit